MLLLRPDRVTLRRHRPGLRGRGFEEHPLPIDPPSSDFEEVCERALPALRNALASSAVGGSLRVLVGDRWTRVQVIEGNFYRLNDRQIDLMAEVALQEVLDHTPARSAYRWQIQRGGGHLFASGMMPGVAERAGRLGADLGLGRVSVSTHFAVAWNDSANPIVGRDTGVFAVVAGQYASVAWVSNGILTGITQAGLPSGADALDRRVDRDMAAWGVDVDAGLKFVLAGSETPASARWQRYDLFKRTVA